MQCTPRMNPNGLWVTMMCQCSFINCNKCTTLVGNIDMGEALHVWGREYMGNLCTFPLSFAVNLKLLQKIVY